LGFIPLMVRLPIDSLFRGEIDVAEPDDGTTTVADQPGTTLETGGMQHHRNPAIPTRWRTSRTPTG
jgi:hypothetical protein